MRTNNVKKDGLFVNDDFKRIITKFDDEKNDTFENLMFNLEQYS